VCAVYMLSNKKQCFILISHKSNNRVSRINFQAHLNSTYAKFTVDVIPTAYPPLVVHLPQQLWPYSIIRSSSSLGAQLKQMT
jgi:hypothetical protein